MKSTLKIFIAEACYGCTEARRIAAAVTQSYPHLHVEVIDIGAPEAKVPEAVFATPTYMLNGRIVSLGNPSPVEIARWAGAVEDQSED